MRRPALGTLFLVSLCMLRFCIGKASFNWVHQLDGAGATFASQASNALGMLLAGLLVLFVLRFFWNGNEYGFAAYAMLVLIALSLTMYVAFAMDGAFTWVSIIPLDMVQKLIIYPILVAPAFFAHDDGKPSYAMEALGFAVCALGTSAYALTLTCCGEGACSALVAVAFVALVTCVFAMTAMVALDGQRRATSAAGVVGNDELVAGTTGLAGADESQAGSPAQDGAARAKARACEEIASTYQLTRRERDILPLLVDRLSAAEVAERLVVSVATAKTHIRNIYAKLDIHSAHELQQLYAARSEAGHNGDG